MDGGPKGILTSLDAWLNSLWLTQDYLNLFIRYASL